MSTDHTHGLLRDVYALDNQSDTDAYYTRWAATYDRELTDSGYRTPARCAAALARFVELDAPIIDIGCGTGLSGRALADAGFVDVTGTDVNAEMLAVADAARIYRSTWLTDLEAPYPFTPGTYSAIAAVGVIGVGAAPASVLGSSLHALAPGGRLVFSYNDRALETAEFVDALATAIDTGLAVEESAERGPHIEALGSRATVYILRRT